MCGVDADGEAAAHEERGGACPDRPGCGIVVVADDGLGARLVGVRFERAWFSGVGVDVDDRASSVRVEHGPALGLQHAVPWRVQEAEPLSAFLMPGACPGL